MEEIWGVMSQQEINIFALGWAMKWEELEEDTHFAYLAGNVPIYIIFVYV